MGISISKRLLSDKLHEILLQEVDFKDSKINKFIDNIALNIILKSLSQKKRIKFYRLLSNDNYTDAQKLIKTEIPNLNKQILIKVRKKFKEILK